MLWGSVLKMVEYRHCVGCCIDIMSWCMRKMGEDWYGIVFLFFRVVVRQLWVLAAAQKHQHKTIHINQQNDKPTYCVKMSKCQTVDFRVYPTSFCWFTGMALLTDWSYANLLFCQFEPAYQLHTVSKGAGCATSRLKIKGE